VPTATAKLFAYQYDLLDIHVMRHLQQNVTYGDISMVSGALKERKCPFKKICRFVLTSFWPLSIALYFVPNMTVWRLDSVFAFR
jgi:hypothetical protein